MVFYMYTSFIIVKPLILQKLSTLNILDPTFYCTLFL